MTRGLDEHVETLAADLSGRGFEQVHDTADGTVQALFVAAAHPPRALVPRRWLHTGGLAFDTCSRTLAGTDSAPGTFYLRPGDGSGECAVPARAAPLCWSADGRVLAGTTSGPRPTLWTYRADDGDLRRFDDVEVSRSLLGSVEGPASPLYWTDGGDLLVLAASTTSVDASADLVIDEGDGHGGLDDPEAVLAAARVDVVRLRPDGSRDIVSRPGAVCCFAPGPDGRGVRVGSVPDVQALARLTRERRARVDLVDVRVVHRSALPRGRATARVPDRAREASGHDVHRLSDEVMLHLPRGVPAGSVPTVLWLQPLPDVDRGRRERIPPMSTDGGCAPPGPVWAYLPRCAVALVRLWHPRQDAHTSFDLFADRVTGAVRAAAELVRDTLGPTRLALAGHSFGAAVAAITLPEVADVVDCAVLRSGAYNRTLTPGGFQLERRPLWDAPGAYHGFTVLHAAPRIRVPTLLLQGRADPNTATTVLQARLFYESLRLAGNPSRLILLGGEGHLFGTAEGILRAVHEENAWIYRWCRDDGRIDRAEYDDSRNPVGATHPDRPDRSEPRDPARVPTAPRT